jgi:hypothetical protein
MLPSFLAKLFTKKNRTLVLVLLTLLCFNAQAKTQLASVTKLEPLNIETLAKQQSSGLVSVKISSTNLEKTLLLQPNTSFTSKLILSKPITQTFYDGTIEGTKGSWVKLIFKEDKYKGAFYDGYELFFIDTFETVKSSLSISAARRFSSLSASAQVIYNATDVINNGTCGNDEHNHSLGSFDYQAFIEDLDAIIGDMATRELEINLVADTEYSALHNGAAIEQMLLEMFIVDQIFSAQLNVQLTIIGSVALSDNANLVTTNPDDLIVAFRTFVSQEIGNSGLTHLFTGKDLDSSTVGIAYIGALCSQFGVGLSQSIGANTALVVAHELGHNFGSRHDNVINNSIPSAKLLDPAF